MFHIILLSLLGIIGVMIQGSRIKEMEEKFIKFQKYYKIPEDDVSVEKTQEVLNAEMIKRIEHLESQFNYIIKDNTKILSMCDRVKNIEISSDEARIVRIEKNQNQLASLIRKIINNVDENMLINIKVSPLGYVEVVKWNWLNRDKINILCRVTNSVLEDKVLKIGSDCKGIVGSKKLFSLQVLKKAGFINIEIGDIKLTFDIVSIVS